MPLSRLQAPTPATSGRLFYAGAKNLILWVVTILFLLFGHSQTGLRAASPQAEQPTVDAAHQKADAADEFDWRDMPPLLSRVAGLAPEKAVKELLENTAVLRDYVALELQAQCGSGAPACDLKPGDPTLEAAITKRIDDTVRGNIFTRRNVTRVDYLLSHQPFPFTAITAMKSGGRQDAFLVLDFAENSYTSAQIESKYGSPRDKSIFQRFSMFEYRIDEKTYVAHAAFTIDPVTGQARRLAISLKRKNVQQKHADASRHAQTR